MRQHNETRLLRFPAMIAKYVTFVVDAAVIVVSLVACQSENDLPNIQVGDEIEFAATLRNTVGVTRAQEGSPVKLDSVYIERTPFDMPFFIELCSKKDGTDVHEIGKYEVPSGNQGQLKPMAPNKPLTWQTLDEKHTFYSWNLPWDKDYAPEMAKDAYVEAGKPIKIEFRDSENTTGYNENKNNAYLEHFIGTKTKSYNYKTYGKYVDMTFQHLVSKIKINEFKLINSDGSIQKHLQANITFINMPKEATFYPHPSENPPSDVDKWASIDDRPRVDKPWTQEADEGVTFYIDNKPNDASNVFYVCPEIDFSEIDYQIKLLTDGYQYKDTYYGTFDDVIFERIPNSAYDKGEDMDSKILHAGEEMTLNIVLIPGIGPGLSLVISPWSTEKPTDAVYHPYPGIFSDAEINDFIRSFAEQNRDSYENDPDFPERFFDLYGEKRINEKGEIEKVFPLYDNFLNATNYNNIFPIPRGYVLDGQGHTVSMRTNSGTYGWSAYYNIGYCRDIYLTDLNGENSIYIDSEYHVWITDPDTGEFVWTENQLTPLTGNNKGYDIDAKTGKVLQTTYFNNNIPN